MADNPLDDLIAKLEAATEGSRELDAEIGLVINGPPDAYTDPDNKPGYFRIPGAGSINSTWIKCAYYTTSLDAALTLVPPRLGIMWDVAKYPGESAAAYVGQRDVVMREFMVAKTPALAFCIAVLKAQLKALGLTS